MSSIHICTSPLSQINSDLACYKKSQDSCCVAEWPSCQPFWSIVQIFSRKIQSKRTIIPRISIFFPEKNRDLYKWTDFRLSNLLMIFICFPFECCLLLQRNALLPFLPPIMFYFSSVSEAVTLYTILWVLILIEVVPEKMCTWHVTEWLIGSRYKYFWCQGFVKLSLWYAACWIPIMPAG